ncbi:MAG TPA: hypothetical protein VIB82_02725, partial [Caulobacteraceae bacterium]
MFVGWNNYFYLVGSAGGGLIGLLFVVVTLTAGSERSQALYGAKVYFTPTAIHFAVVLSISAVAIAPGLSVPATAGLFGLIALVGLFHAAQACVSIGSRRAATAHWSDFWMYGAGPTVIYIALVAAAVATAGRFPWSVHALAALLLTLLLTAIRNA